MHLDVKFENIMFDEQRQTFKLIDFGNSIDIYNDKTDNIIGFIGSPLYIDP